MNPVHILRNIAAALLASCLLWAAPAAATKIRVTVENLAPQDGIYLTPVWVAFHDGSFDTFSEGSAVSAPFERLEEDGNTMPLTMAFADAGNGGQDATLLEPSGFPGMPVFDPGKHASQVFDVDPASQRYFSFASMVIPSNDAFIGNDDPQAHPLFDDQGHFLGPIVILVSGHQVLDAGSEVNTETDAAFLNQSAPDTGEDENGVVGLHPGFNGSLGNPDATPVNILGGTSAAGVHFDATAADFTRPNYRVARITITAAQQPVRVTVHSLTPPQGLFLTPFWVAFHDGSFDLFDQGAAASAPLERVAEDGTTMAITSAFEADHPDGQDATIVEPGGFPGMPVFDPGSTASQVFTLDSETQRYFSFASMVIPSNDAFIGNDEPEAYPVFNDDGSVRSRDIIVNGNQVLDAGTEVNNEMDAAFFNQSAPNTGTTENGVIMLHPGLNGSLGNPDGTPVNILGGTSAAGVHFDKIAADFTQPGAQLVDIHIGPVVDGSFSGSWYDPSRSGEGLMIDIYPRNGLIEGVATFYTFAPDGSGDQAWIQGSGPVVGDTLIISNAYLTTGASFGDAFDPDAVQRQPWGEMRIKFDSCDSATFTYDSTIGDFGSGSHELTRLTPVEVGGACQ